MTSLAGTNVPGLTYLPSSVEIVTTFVEKFSVWWEKFSHIFINDVKHFV
jgi:hypothetical protein